MFLIFQRYSAPSYLTADRSRNFEKWRTRYLLLDSNLLTSVLRAVTISD